AFCKKTQKSCPFKLRADLDVKPLISQFGFDAVRVDEIQNSGKIDGNHSQNRGFAVALSILG
ncbi:MAG: hypothetical protein Q9M22_04560, partial [Mariprofundaceae bacterium]|nr:hypothetical protein [Mariprofundaceae bacterium]